MSLHIALEIPSSALSKSSGGSKSVNSWSEWKEMLSPTDIRSFVLTDAGTKLTTSCLFTLNFISLCLSSHLSVSS